MKAPVYITLITFVIALLSGCSRKDTLPEPYPTDSLGKINRWILDSMRQFYYWSDQIPARPDYSLSPDRFFTSLLSTRDRFSHISGPGIPAPGNSYFTYGFQYAFIQVPGYMQYIGVMTFINTNGAAYHAGFKRGSYFIKVNGSPITAQNIEALNKVLNNPGNITLTPARYNNNTWEAGEDTTLYRGYAAENAVYYTRVFTGNNIKTGYLYYSSFNESYDGALLEAFGKLKREGVKELILDLRYNAGGSVASCAKLAAMIAGRLTGSEIFAIYEGNRQEGKRARTLQQVLNTSGNTAGKQYQQLQAQQLNLNRIFIITTAATVSAAEMLVNNLKPFLEVIQIGETTTGKDEASFTITDLRVPKQVEWTLQPIVYKLFNKNGEGNYAGGISPRYPVAELAVLPLGQVGANGDALVHKALELIYGQGYAGDPEDLRQMARHPRIQGKPVFSSAAAQAAVAAPVTIR